MVSGDQRGDSEECSWSLIMSALGRDAFLIPSPPRCLSSPSGQPHPPPSAPMESPGHMASGLFSETDALTVLCLPAGRSAPGGRRQPGGLLPVPEEL